MTGNLSSALYRVVYQKAEAHALAKLSSAFECLNLKKEELRLRS